MATREEQNHEDGSRELLMGQEGYYPNISEHLGVENAILPLFQKTHVKKLGEKERELLASNLDAKLFTAVMKQLLTDDDVVEVASQRGLLIKFKIKPFMSHSESAIVEVEAPEFASVKFLKRRFFKASLFRNTYLEMDQYSLYSEQNPRSGEIQSVELEDCEQNTFEKLLFNIGFRAGNTYLIKVKLQPSSNDKEQQNTMLRESAAQGRSIFSQYGFSDDPEIKKRQELLQGKAREEADKIFEIVGGEEQPSQRTSPAKKAKPSPAKPALEPLNLIEYDSTPGKRKTRAATQEEKKENEQTEQGTTGRRNLGKWQIEETRCLIRGCEEFNFSWREIQSKYSGNGIHPERTQVDYKDKWRNIKRCINLKTEPRGFKMDDYDKEQIRALMKEEKNKEAKK